jgi:uncharacterized protein YndB with AHSA1/START domain
MKTKKSFTATQSIGIRADISRVWDVLTKPELFKQVMFGTEIVSDWKVGSSITYKGEWEGKPYEDKGKIIEIQPPRLLVSTYWSAFSGLADAPENYQTVSYELTPEDGGTRLTVTQENNETETSARRSEQNWWIVLVAIKELLEG